MRPRLLLSTAAVAACTIALDLAAPTPAEAVQQLGSTAQATDLAEPLVAAAALLAWALLAHLLLVGLLTLAAALPGRSGHAGRAVLTRCAPVRVRRAVAVALGVGLLVGSGASMATAAPAPAAAAVSLDWPATDRAAPVTGLGSLDWPEATPAPAVTPRSAPRVTVADGDSLWSLAREALPAGATDSQVAASWPSWWSANRQVVGEDPDLIHPGQSLRVPHRPRGDRR